MSLKALQRFYLVGGTSLALQLGHRISVDLDLFTIEPFEKLELIDLLNAHFEEVAIDSESANLLITKVNQVKVDFVKMGYPILFPTIEIEGIRMLDIRDIAPMILKAIAQRGSKKDFYDLFFLLDLLPLSEIMGLFSEKFKQYEIFHIIKSLTYFEDAEQYADPLVFDANITWDIVKNKIFESVIQLTKTI